MGFPSEKSWRHLGPPAVGRSKVNGFAAWEPYSDSVIASAGSLVSSSNAPEYRNLGGTDGDIGGVFELIRERTTRGKATFKSPLVEGDVWATYNSAGLDMSKTVERITESNQRGLGATAIANAAPTEPSFNFLTSLGELGKDGLPQIFGSGLAKEKANFLKGSSSEYLNYEFGWKPLVSDVRKFARTVRDADKIIAGYRAGSDQHIRRRHLFPPESLYSSYEGTCFMYPSSGMAYEGPGEHYATFQSEGKSWFSGAFRYHVPLGDSVPEKLDRYKSYAGKLLGVRLTPDTLWNLAPWSWAADWFSNTGDIMSNISNMGTDGLVMQYGYMMGSTRESIESHWSFRGRGQTLSGTYSWDSVKKTRFKASPYGFDLTWDGLSTRQQAIVAALGITRSGGRR